MVVRCSQSQVRAPHMRSRSLVLQVPRTRLLMLELHRMKTVLVPRLRSLERAPPLPPSVTRFCPLSLPFLFLLSLASSLGLSIVSSCRLPCLPRVSPPGSHHVFSLLSPADSRGHPCSDTRSKMCNNRQIWKTSQHVAACSATNISDPD